MPPTPPPAAHDGPSVRRARWAELDPFTLHALVRLRADVFVVEQQCPFPDLDGKDVLATTEHVWTADATGPTSYLRELDPDGPDGRLRVGRVCTRADARGTGLSGLLLRDVLRRHPGREVVLDAQAHLEAWYAAFGFVRCGPGYVEDGIPHVPMLRPPTSAADASPDAGGGAQGRAVSNSRSGTRGPV